VVDHTATARIQRLVRWLEQFKRCFGHRAQLLSLRTYVQGFFSDSERKSMQAMLARVTEPVAYQAFQHFYACALGRREVWRRLRAVIPERRGVLILDGTSTETRATRSARSAAWRSAKSQIAKWRRPSRCGPVSGLVSWGAYCPRIG
jgi:SRSO17 transposase